MNNMRKSWFNISDKIRFLLVGSFNAGFSYLIYSAICFFISEAFYQHALATAWILTSITSFLTQRFLVFNIEGNLFKQYCKCCITWFFSYLINAFILEILVQNIGINVYFSQIIATIFSAIFNYVMFKVFAFRCIK